MVTFFLWRSVSFSCRDMSQNVKLSYIGVARGCSGCTCTPQGRWKIFFRPNLQEKCVSAPPGHEAGWLRFGGIFRWSFRVTTKKGRQLFWEKVHPQTKSWLRLCCHMNLSKSCLLLCSLCVMSLLVLCCCVFIYLFFFVCFLTACFWRNKDAYI